MESAIAIRRLAPSDADSVLNIQSRCPELAQWSKRDYEGIDGGNTVGWIALKSVNAETGPIANPAPIVGFITARIAADEMEILNLGVDPEERRRGAAKALLQAALSWGSQNRASRAFLEVRASNSAAIRLYESHGFQTTGRRANYYSSPSEDALQLSASLASMRPD